MEPPPSYAKQPVKHPAQEPTRKQTNHIKKHSRARAKNHPFRLEGTVKALGVLVFVKL